MKYISTRGNIAPKSSLEAIRMGMVSKGGLFVPEKIPFIPMVKINSWKLLSYSQLASNIFNFFLNDNFTKNEVNNLVKKVYNKNIFQTEEITPLKKLTEKLYILELFHGPTGAFKDIALQALPLLLSESIKKLNIKNKLLILVATSGDTGKAALEGFKNIPGIEIIVYYPFQKVSKIQELQMLTTDGNNTHVVALKGNFDDCQNAVKEIFADYQFCRYLEKNSFEFSSANSINWGRLFPQIVYYFYAYASLLKNNEIKCGEKINISVPTGNFGNILAAWYANQMGLPVNKLICASNINNVLTDFFQTGTYNRNRPLISTSSPSMDILISSNLERFLFEITGHDHKQITFWMNELQDKGQFELTKNIKEKIKQKIFAGFADEKQTLNTIKKVFEDYNYLVDPHTAVGIKVFFDFQKSCETTGKTIVAATASPFKFNQSVLLALNKQENDLNKNEFNLLQELGKLSGLTIPINLSNLENKKIIHNLIYEKTDAKKSLLDILNIRQ